MPTVFQQSQLLFVQIVAFILIILTSTEFQLHQSFQPSAVKMHFHRISPVESVGRQKSISFFHRIPAGVHVTHFLQVSITHMWSRKEDRDA